MQTDSCFFPTSIPAHRSIAAVIIAPVTFWRTAAGVFDAIFFHGSTDPFGGAPRQLGQFRFRQRPLPITAALLAG
jgi:hypothetical protein